MCINSNFNGAPPAAPRPAAARQEASDMRPKEAKPRFQNRNILNWATGEEKTQEKLEIDPQLMIYYYAVNKLYPEIDNCIVTIYFINDR